MLLSAAAHSNLFGELRFSFSNIRQEWFVRFEIKGHSDEYECYHEDLGTAINQALEALNNPK